MATSKQTPRAVTPPTLAELIALHAADLGQDYPAIADRLNAPTIIDNPRAGEKSDELVPLDMKMLLPLVPPAETAKIYTNLPGIMANIQDAIDTHDRDYLGYLLSVVATNGAISPTTTAALTPLLTKTVEVVAPATIAGPSLASAAGLGTVSAAQVQAVLNA